MKKIHLKCPYCGAQAVLAPASSVRKDADCNEKVYVCARYPVCDAYVSAHQESLLPMGTLADRHLRIKRRQAHIALNRLWERGLMTKKETYHWLQFQLGIPESEAHIGRFAEYRCNQVIDLCSRFINAGRRSA